MQVMGRVGNALPKIFEKKYSSSIDLVTRPLPSQTKKPNPKLPNSKRKLTRPFNPAQSVHRRRPSLLLRGSHPFQSSSRVIIRSRLPVFVACSRMFSLKCSCTAISINGFASTNVSKKFGTLVVCDARGPRPRYPRVWKTRNRIGTISKSEKLVDCIKKLSNVKEEVYGALDSFVAWDLEFPLIAVKKALKTLESQKEWKRIIQVIKWMLSKGQGKTMGTYFTLLNALAEDGRLEEAEQLWSKIFSENLESLPRVFFIKMISLYYARGMHDKVFEIFADMEELGMRPEQTIVTMVGDVFKKLGMLDKFEKLNKKYPPTTWEYRYIKGKRVRIRVKNTNDANGRMQVEQLKDANDEPNRTNNELDSGDAVYITDSKSEEPAG